jgi:hypothetical protein
MSEKNFQLFKFQKSTKKLFFRSLFHAYADMTFVRHLERRKLIAALHPATTTTHDRLTAMKPEVADESGIEVSEGSVEKADNNADSADSPTQASASSDSHSDKLGIHRGIFLLPSLSIQYHHRVT